MKIFKNIFFKYVLLVVFSFLFQILFSKIILFVFFDFLENILFAVALVFPLYFYNSVIYKRFYYYVSYIVFALCLYLETSYYYLFKTFFSSSAIFVTLDSNAEESKEFLNFYIDVPVVIFGCLFLLVVAFMLFKSKMYYNEIPDFSKRTRLKMFFLFLGVVILTRQTTLIRFNLPYLIIKAGIEYHSESKILGDYKNNKLGNFNNVSRISNHEEDEVYVVIIGESTARSHLGIYSYYRETTPKLSSIKDELLIYNDVVSPHAYSVGSLTKILTLGNYENPKGITDGTIIQLLNKAGFDTYWFSNQRPIGIYESMITKIALSSKNHEFITTTVAGDSSILDEELLDLFNEALANDAKKKVIFLHMMGTHHHYEKRYTKAFNKFKDEPKTNFKSEESIAKINHYDNAVLYNDYIISEVISKLDSINKKSFALYFSDHGEEMYSGLNMAGHNEDIYSKQMFEVPFFLWQSEKFKTENDIFFDEDRKYMIDDFFHSLADILSISAKEVDLKRSIFNKGFKERKRIIKDTIHFDTFFK